MTKIKLLTNAQMFNGQQGETRSAAILGKRFHIFKGTVDVQGIDLMVEIIPETMYDLQLSKNKIKVFGLVQCKYFQKGTTLKIDVDYVEDEDGIITNFFALIHTTDDREIDHYYFFTAQDIKEKFSMSHDRRGNLYYTFRVSKKNNFESHRNLEHSYINDVITKEIKRTAEYRHQSVLNKADEKWIRTNAKNEDYTRQFHESLKGRHIVDKLWYAASYFDGFRHILAWRMVDKMSFNHKIYDSTFYNQFTLKSTNQEIIDFFDSISIDEDVTIANEKFFKDVKQPVKKANDIVRHLNDSNIFHFDGIGQKKSIRLINNQACNCAMCLYENLDFVRAYDASRLTVVSASNHYDALLSASIMFSLHFYGVSLDILTQLVVKTNATIDVIPRYIAHYNIEIAQRYALQESSVDLYYELLKLPLDREQKSILKSISERILLNDFKKSVDELYLTIKDYKERVNNFSTGSQIEKLRAKIIECYYFYKENRCFITDEFDVLFEKYIESCCISFSMKAPNRSHLRAFGDFEVMVAVLYCRPERLLRFIQRNNISEIHYESGDCNFFLTCIHNFFSEDNLEFLDREIRFVDNRTANPDLRRKTAATYTSLCYLMSYLDIGIGENEIESILRFISKVDFSMDELSAFAHPLLNKPQFFSVQNLLKLVNIILAKKDFKSYLLTNILRVLAEKKFIINDEDLFNELVAISIEQNDIGLMSALNKLLSDDLRDKYRNTIQRRLTTDFNATLFSEAVKTENLPAPTLFCELYANAITDIIEKESYIVFDNTNTVTGLSNYKHLQIIDFIIVSVLLGRTSFDKEVLQKVEELHPYFNFLLNLEDFKQEDEFSLVWLSVDFNTTIIQKIAENKVLNKVIKEMIKNCNDKKILKIYAQFF